MSVALVACLLIACQDSQASSLAEASDGPTTEEHAFLAAPTAPEGIAAEPADEAGAVFDQSKVLTYDLTIAPLDLAVINALPSAEQYVPATLKLLGESRRVAVRYKGSVGGFLAPCTAQTVAGLVPPIAPKTGKCSFKLSFDEYDSEARFRGLKKINLHAMGHDSSLMKERLGYALFREMGVAAPRAVHARVVINGKLEGVFAAVEEIDGRFTRSRFLEGGKGNLYKEVWPTNADASYYRKALETNKSDTTSVAKMLAFKRAIDENPAKAAATWIDRQYMLAYIAVDRAILNDDGFLHWYCFTNHNYFWYEAVATDRMWLIPWDLDDSFALDSTVALLTTWDAPATTCGACGIGGSFGEYSAQRTPTCDPLTREFASWTGDYDATVDRLLRGPFSAASVDAKLDRWSKQIDALVVEATDVHGAEDRATWQKGVANLRAVIAQARRNRGK